MLDYRSAKSEGYSDDEILEYLKTTRTDFDYDSALKEGYTLPEIAEHVSSMPVKPPPVTSLGTPSPITVTRPKNAALPSTTNTSTVFEEPFTPAEVKDFGKSFDPVKAFSSGVGDVAAGVTQAVASDLTTPFPGFEPGTVLDKPQQDMYDYGKTISESGKKPKKFYDRTALNFYKEREFTTKLQKKSQEAGVFLEKVAEQLRIKPVDEAKNTEDAQEWLKHPDALNPMNAAKTLSAVATVAAQSGPYVASSMVPGFGPAVMVGSETGNFIEQAKADGLDDPAALREGSRLYGLTSGAMEYLSDMVLTAPLKKVGGGVAGKAMTKVVPKDIKSKAIKSILNGAVTGLGEVVEGAATEGGTELSQNYLQNVLEFYSFASAAKNNPAKAEEYLAKARSISLNPVTKKNLEAAYFGALAGGFTKGTMAAAGKTIQTVTKDRTKAVDVAGQAEAQTQIKTQQETARTGKILRDFNLDIDTYYQKPQAERDQIFNQLSDTEQERVYSQMPEGIDQATIPVERTIEKPSEEANIQVSDPLDENRIVGMVTRLKAAGEAQERQAIIDGMTPTEAKEVLARSQGIPKADISGMSQEEIDQVSAYAKEGRPLGGRTTKGGALPRVEKKMRYMALDHNKELEELGPKIEKELGDKAVAFKMVEPGITQPGKPTIPPTMSFRDEYTGSNINIPAGASVDDLRKKIEAVRTADSESAVKTIAGKVGGLEYVSKEPIVGKARGVGKYDTAYIYKFKDPDGVEVSITPEDTPEKVKKFLEFKKGATNVQPMQQTPGQKTETPLSVPSEQTVTATQPEPVAPPVKIDVPVVQPIQEKSKTEPAPPVQKISYSDAKKRAAVSRMAEVFDPEVKQPSTAKVVNFQPVYEYSYNGKNYSKKELFDAGLLKFQSEGSGKAVGRPARIIEIGNPKNIENLITKSASLPKGKETTEIASTQSVEPSKVTDPSKIKLQTRALDMVLKRYIDKGIVEGGNSTELHKNIQRILNESNASDVATAAGVSEDVAKMAVKYPLAEAAKKIRQAFAPNLLYGQSVDEVLNEIKQKPPEAEQQAIDFEALKKQYDEEPWNVTAQQQELLLEYEKKNAPAKAEESPAATSNKYDQKVMESIVDAITRQYGSNQRTGFRTRIKVFADSNKPSNKELVDFAVKTFPRIRDYIPTISKEPKNNTPEPSKKQEAITEDEKKGFSVDQEVKVKGMGKGKILGFERNSFNKDVLVRVDRGTGKYPISTVNINDVSKSEPELSKKDQAKKLFLEKQNARKEKEPTAEEKIALEKEKAGDALKRAQDALNRLGKSFEQRDPNTLYSIGTEQAEIAFEAVSALIEAGYHEFKALSIKVSEMAKEYMKVKGFRDAIEDAFDAYTEVDTKIPKRKISIDEAVKTEEKKTEEKPVKKEIGADLPVKERLIKSLVTVFYGGNIKNTRELLDYADKAYGGTVAEGKYGIRDAYDALEAAFNMYLESTGIVSNMAPKDAILFLNEQMKLLPTQTVRTENQVELQQFSTPPSEAYLVSLLAGIRKGMTALEPSAGDGSIAVQARMQGAEVSVNEIDKGRQENLRILRFNPTGVDAEYLNSTLPDVTPDVVVMNPPFSATGGRLKAHNTGFGAEHVYQALLRLKPGGRLVAIVGNGMALGKPKMASWWNKIMSGYNLRANVGISGKEYVKYGTGFDNNIIVIDKTGPTDRTGGMPNSVITGEGLTVEQAYDRMKALTEDDVYGRIKAANAGKSTKVADGKNGEPNKEKPVVGNDNDNSVGSGGGITPTKRTGTKRAPVAGMDKLSDRLPGSAGGSGLSAPNGSGKANTDTAGKPDNGAGKENDISAGQPRGELHGADEVAIEEESGGVYAKYRVSKANYKGSKEHPAKVSESVAMASVKPPDVTYKLHLPQSLIEGGAVSDVQLEAITYACQAHEQMLPTGQRKEFLLGDGTGMGKARTLIGIIQENWLQGRKKVVYITKSADLVNQLKADMDAMGVKIPVIEQGKFKQDEGIDAPNGILFTTYSTASGEFKTSKKRYRQILDWFGKDNDGVFIFDESHLMKNVSESKFEFGGETKDLKEGADRGQMGVSFKNDLKNARFVNASATAATTPVNLAYLSRLGLWGPGTPFKDFIAFLNVMKDGGTGAMELLSRDLKSNGLYLSRSISFDGVEYETVTHNLSEHEVATYNNMADFWAMMLEKIDEAAKNAHMKGEKQKIMKQFYSAQQRFFLQLMMSFQAESMVKDADAQLEDGKSVVISLYNTNESQTNKKINEAIANGDDLDAIEFSPKDSMKTMLEHNFPIIQYEEFTDENGTKGTRQVMDSNGEPLINKENYDVQQELIEKIASLVIPENPIDKLVNHFGVENIAEITGRKNRLIINSTGHREYKARGSKDVPQKKINQHEREAFMSGKKRVAIISGAAATGFDLHSSLRAKNQERRAFYAMQLSWSADEQMQAFGRVHRTMQKSEPIIKLMKTNITSQMRLVNTIQSRLASLGAMTKGGREALSGGIFTTEDITDQYGQAALRSTYNDASNATLKRMNILDKEGGVKQSAMGNVDGFLNRIMVLPIKDQNEIFNNFYARYQQNVEEAKNNGTYDEGIRKIAGENVRVVSEETLHKDEVSGVETKLVHVEAETPVHKEEFDATAERINRTSIRGYIPVINAKSKRGYIANKMPDGSYHIYGPRGFHKVVEYQQYYDTYKTEKEEIVKQKWQEEYDKIPATETRKTVLVTGSIFPVYGKVFDDKDTSSKKVKRAVLENGDSVIGIEVSQNKIPKIKQNFGIGSDLYTASAKEILDLINADSIIELDNGWKISVSRVMGEKRIEVKTGNSSPTANEMAESGMFGEIIAYTKRYFIPIDRTKAETALESILKYHKAVRDRSAGEFKASIKEKSSESKQTPTDQTPEESRISEAVYKSQGKQPTPGAIKIAEGDKKLTAALEEATGKKVVWLDINDDQMVKDIGHTFNGFMFRGATDPELADKIFINTNTDKPAEWIAYHEFTHFLQQNPEYSAAFWDAAKLTTRGKELVVRKGREETMADIAGEIMADPKFWESIAKNKSVFKTFIDELMRIFKKIADAFKKTKAEAAVENIDQVRETLQGIMRDYTGENISETAERMAAAVKGDKKITSNDFPIAGNIVDGLAVRDDVPNTGSISASLENYEELPGIREFPLSELYLTGKSYSASETRRIENLAEQIKESGEINPLIVVNDNEGYYILEGGHRAEALFLLGKKTLPAMIVVDNDSINQPMFSRKERKVPVQRKRELIEEPGVKERTGQGQTVNTTYYQINDIQKKRNDLKKKIGKIKDETLDERIRMVEEIQRLDELNRDKVIAAIYQYAERIGLRGESYNMVDRLMKNSKGKTGLLRAVEVMDNVMERKQHSRYLKAAKQSVADAYTYLTRISGTTRATTDLETNRALKGYLAQLTGGTEEDQRKAQMLVRYYNEYGDTDIKKNRDSYIEELGKDVIDWIEGDHMGPMPDNVNRLIKSLASKGLEGLSNTQLVRVVSDLRNLRREGRTMKALQEQKRKEAFDRDTESIAKTINANSKSIPESRAQKSFLVKKSEDVDRERRKASSGGIEYDLTDSERIIQKLAGEQGRSLFKRTVFDPMYQADTEKKRNIKKALKWYEDTHRDPDTGKVISMAEVRQPLVDISVEVDVDGQKVQEAKTQTIADVMKIYAHSRNPSQREHLIWTMVEPSKKATREERQAENEVKRAVAEAMIDKAITALPEKYKTMVEKTWKHYEEEQYDRINKIFSEEHGIDMPKEKNYFPIRGLQLERNGGTVEADLLARSGLRAGVAQGFTKGRVQSTAALGSGDYFDDLIQNILQTEHYIAFAQPVKAVSRALNQPDVRNAIQNYSKSAWNAIDDWLKAMAYGRMNYGTTDRAYDKVIRTLRNNYSVFQLGLKLITIAIQPSSWFKGISGVSKKQAVASIFRMMRNPALFNREINEKSAQQESRMQNYEQGIQESIENNMAHTVVGDLKNREKVIDTIRGAVMAPMGAVDKGVSNLVWDAKYHESIEKGMPESDAIYSADELVRKTQSGGGLLSSSMFMRGNEFMRMFTQFQSDPTKTLNMLLEFKNHIKEMDVADTANLIIFAVIAPAMFSYMVRNLRWPWDEPEEVGKEAERSIVSSIPIFGAIFDAAATVGLDQIKRLRGVPVDKSGYDYITDMDVPLLSSASTVAEGITRGKPLKIVEGVAQAVGVPAGGQIKRIIEGIDISIKHGNAKYLITSKKAVNKEFDQVIAAHKTMPSEKRSPTEVMRNRAWANKVYESWSPEKKKAFDKYRMVEARIKAEPKIKKVEAEAKRLNKE